MAPRGIDVGAVEAWLEAQLTDFPPPYNFTLIAAGGSNLTYQVSAGNGEVFVLRRPPVSARIATAHDMQREYRIMNALRESAVPVPRMLAQCSDVAITGAEFYCMEWVRGVALREQADCVSMSAADCERASESLVDAQVAFHQIDLAAVGLADLAQHKGYVQRQLKRWKKQVETASTRELPLFHDLHARLSEAVPESRQAPGLAHGDYRFDNCILDSDYRVRAVLDWELCTIGDPLADFVWSLNYWAEPGEELTWLLSPPTCHPNFPSRATIVEYYAERSGIEPGEDMDWYTAFSWWKQAAIVEGVYARLQQGASGGMKVQSLDAVGTRVLDYLNRANEVAAQL
jgi:aminoglycoside phosphotransferase (APT) family kinase protein